MVAHFAFGLRIEANVAIPGLTVRAAHAKPDVTIRFGDELPDTPMQPLYDGGDVHAVNRYLSVSRDRRGDYRLTYADGTKFAVDEAGSSIAAWWPPSLTLEDTATYLLGPVFGFVLRLRGVASIHASCVVIGDEAVAFAGPAGAGKSTIAAAFAQLGVGVLSDDVTAVKVSGEHVVAVPSYERVRLWGESTRGLFGSDEALPRIVPSSLDWDKRYVDLAERDLFVAREVRLTQLYLLRERGERLEIAPVRRAAVLTALLRNSYVHYLLDDRTRASDFETLARMAKDIPAAELSLPDSFEALAGACRELLQRGRQAVAV